jgi:hypothetical protein
MKKHIKNDWHRQPGASFAKLPILDHQTHPEGLDICRLRFLDSGSFSPQSSVAHIISIYRGKGRLLPEGADKRSLSIEAGVHLYLPPHIRYVLDAEAGTELVQVSSPTDTQARGKHLLLRDETFIVACASGSQLLRWILTPQYLSRRIFLHHDPVLLSRSGNPISWFRTTMFDVIGLPENEEGEPVFKMSYNSRTECNVCYDVQGTARVRMAKHPYCGKGQLWEPWSTLDGETTYHLNEAAGCSDEECIIDETTRTQQYFRNKHEVYIKNGYVSLYCIFDPAPTGVERHRPGEYSDYEPLSQVLGTKEYEHHQREIAKYDEMVDRLSIAKAMGTLCEYEGTPVWELYLQGRQAQLAIEKKLADALSAEGKGREQVIAQWMQKHHCRRSSEMLRPSLEPLSSIEHPRKGAKISSSPVFPRREQ